MPRPLDHGGVVWVLGLAPLFALDAELVSHGHMPLSGHARAHRALSALLLGLLAAHLFRPDRLARFDPLSAAARRLEPRRTP
jgi:hypothetical protein